MPAPLPISEKIPLLVRDDPWLEPFSDRIVARRARFNAVQRAIEKSHGGLLEYATSHLELGVLAVEGGNSWLAAEWAPQARAVSLIGDFNGWDSGAHCMQRGDDGVWRLELPSAALAHEQRVKLHIHGADGSHRDRIPACIRRAVQDPQSHDFSGQIWAPAEPYHWRHAEAVKSGDSLRIYETHVGMSGEDGRVHTYREFARDVLPRIAGAGYNVIQLMAIQEHPYYGSFGYHVSSFFAPSSRFGTPDDLKHLIDEAHGMGIAVLLDIVHSHAVKNFAEGLNDIDGSGHQYFHAGERGEHPQWDSKCFDYGKPEVRRFLLSNVRMWLEEYHFDGFRFDGITSMLYHSRGMRSFETYEDYFSSDADEDAILYLQLASTLARQIRPEVILVAEDMSGMPGLCRPVAEGGIGFSHRLAMGIPDFWIKLIKERRDEDWEIGEIWGTLTNRRRNEPTIAYAESHDQALVGDQTLAFRLMGSQMYEHMHKDDSDAVVARGMALHKIIRLATMMIGGEAWLNFMGNEFGHPEWIDFPREGNDWSYHYCRRQWSLVDNPELKFGQLAAFDRAMMELEREHQFLAAGPAIELWIEHEKKILCVARGELVVVMNFSVDRSEFGFPFGVPRQGEYAIALDSDAAEFGGFGRLDPSVHGFVGEDHQMMVYAPARTAQVYQKLKQSRSRGPASSWRFTTPGP